MSMLRRHAPRNLRLGQDCCRSLLFSSLFRNLERSLVMVVLEGCIKGRSGNSLLIFYCLSNIKIENSSDTEFACSFPSIPWPKRLETQNLSESLSYPCFPQL